MPSDQTPPPRKSRAPHVPQPGASRRALLVADDDDAVREFVRIVLEQAGFAVTTATNGRDAGDLFVATPDAFALVLTDVVMPFATGVELAARVRALRPRLPVLFMSAFPGGPELAPEPLPPDEPLLEKPFPMARLLETVRAAIRAHDPN
ncbi:response regulator [Gemmata sp. G18]|uniref:Response regulator n=1 Tax=Gemmata palustris TaxID=2822762 RepID=A0ABS5BT96_9BACT|nr:response regulator [Gemmata palustris]MBP3956652.1 response regulator [Gemmata palustris]